MRSPEELVKSFRESGRKVTPQREKIFQILQGNKTHPTAESVYAELLREMPTVSLKTVYQTLHELVGMGEISPLDLGTGSARFDPNQSTHHHLVCTRCHSVKDLYLDIEDIQIPGEQLEGFDAGTAEITFRGHCSKCRTAVSGQSQIAVHQG
ncbi:MAG: transcriptional repressor [Acidimicrobiaceae bacterium]|nr:transcriptional repressor [Acidimicrobiaceae bacterium]